MTNVLKRNREYKEFNICCNKITVWSTLQENFSLVMLFIYCFLFYFISTCKRDQCELKYKVHYGQYKLSIWYYFKIKQKHYLPSTQTKVWANLPCNNSIKKASLLPWKPVSRGVCLFLAYMHVKMEGKSKEEQNLLSTWMQPHMVKLFAPPIHIA